MIGKKIALIGDLHVGVNKNSEDFYEISKKWIKYFVGELEKHKITHIFILGDWHHYRDEISVKTLDVSCELMNYFPKNINIHILTGNHDCYFKDNSDVHSLQMFKEWENITVYDKSTVISTSSGKKINVVPWGGDIKPNGVDYIFGHFEIVNFKMNNYTVCDKGLRSDSLVGKGIDVYTGHFHKYQSKKYKKGSITYVGSPFQHDFNDVDNENGYHILDTETNECTFHKNDDTFPKFKYIKVSELKNFDIDEVNNNYVKLFIDKEVKEDVIEKLLIKLYTKSPKNIIVDDITIKNNLDNSIQLVHNTEVNIKLSIEEFVDKMGDIKYKQEIVDRLKKYYEEKTK
jgi:DNA repair exonuclease SbcCD nuclease subunit